MLTAFWQSCEYMVRHPSGLFALVLGGVALLQAVLGLGRSRQWYMLPVLFGLLALTGFLLNPFADSHAPQDLRAFVTSREALSWLAIGQFLLTCGSLALGLRMTDQQHDGHHAVWLSVLQSVPQPLLVVAMLLWEQACLMTSSNARPDAVGLRVGFAVATVAAFAGLLALALPDRWLRLPHSLLSLALLGACMLVPHLQAPLPIAGAGSGWESLDAAWKVLAGGVVVVAAGWGCSWFRARLHPHLRP